MSHSKKRFWLTLLAVVAVAYGSFLLFVGWAMRQPPEKFGRIMSHMPMPAMMLFPFETMWSQARAGSVQVGEPAPNFLLSTLDHKNEIELASFRGKQPVVLVFGSYT